MRISQIMLAKGFGGAERSFVDTAITLAERGHEVQAICHCGFIEKHRLEGIERLQVEEVNTGGELDWWGGRRITAKIRSFRSQIIHTQLRRAAWHGGRSGRRLGIPVVSKLHNYVDLSRYRYVDHLLCTTLDQCHYALANGWGESAVSVVPNFSRIEPIAVARQLQVGGIRMLSYGRLVKKKGFDLLLRAFRKLLDEGIDAYLKIGGEGNERDALQQLVEELNLTDRVDLGVWLDDVVEALDDADVFILPSLDEPFGIVMLEAIARGVPIISTKTKGPAEVLSDQSAILVDVGSVDALHEGMRRTCENSKLAFERATNGLELYRSKYSADVVVAEVERLYAEVILRKARTSKA
jgi:glycosyltransferase involved in cell wall biosynthesis